MKRIIKIFIVLLVIIIFILTSAYCYLRVKGKDLVVQKIEQQFGHKVSFNSMNFSYPLTVKIENLSIERYGNAKQVIFSFSLPHLLIGEVYFVSIEIIEPVILLARQEDQKISWIPYLMQPSQPQAQEGVPTAPNKPKQPVTALFVRKIMIRNGMLEVFESSGNQTNRIVQLKNIHADIEHISFPIQKSMKTSFDVKAAVSGFEGRFFNEEAHIAGWADFYQKDMLAHATLTGINGQIGLKADLTSVKNDMTVQGRMSLSFKTKASASEATNSTEDFVMQALQSSGANIDLRFQFKTAMDNFKVGKISLSGEMNKNSLK